MMFHSRAAQTPILAAGSALALMTAVLGDSARAETNLDASYTISFARIRVGDITATIAFGDSEYAISANGRAGGVIKVLLDGEGFFTARGKITDCRCRKLNPVGVAHRIGSRWPGCWVSSN